VTLFKPSYPVRAKVRIGEKRQSQGGRSYPTSVDYFVSDDPQLAQLFGPKPQAILVRFPYAAVEDNFSTGLEWWVKSKKQNNVLACYTKDGERALRMSEMVLEDDTASASRSSPAASPSPAASATVPSSSGATVSRWAASSSGSKAAPAKDEVYELDTKSWNSIEALTAAFAAIGDPRGRLFSLSVSFHQKGRDRFPVLALKEVDVKVNSPADAAKADALLQLDASLSTPSDVSAIRVALAGALDLTNPGWRDNEAFVARVKEVGPLAAAKGLLERNLA
jgi:hypothetical protein